MRVLMLIMLSLCGGLCFSLIPVGEGALTLLAGILLGLGLLFLLFLRKQEPRLVLIFIAAGIGVFWGLGYRARTVTPALQYAGTTQEVTCEAISYSTPTEYGIQVEAKLWLPDVETRATLWLSTQESLKPGDMITAKLRLKDSRQSDSYYNYSEGIYLLGYGSGEPEITPCQTIPFRYFPRRIAHGLEQALREVCSEDTVGYAMALTTGNRSCLSDLSRANLKLSGIYHAMALSGMHMAVLVGFVDLLVLKRKRHKALLGTPICVLFTIVTGCSPSVVRAAVMQCLCLSASLFHREKDSPTSLSLALGVLMVENPWCIFNWGLQLSFLSVIGIELLGASFTRFLVERNPFHRKLTQRLWRFVAASLSATASAMLMTMPLMAVYFGFISLVSPITNILTSTVISICFGGSLVTAILGLSCPTVAGILGWCLDWGFRYVDTVAGAFANVPMGQIYTQSLYGLVMLGMIYIVFCICYQSRRRIIPICCGGTLFSLCILFILLEGIAPSVTVLSVGQGQCVLLRNGSGTIMVDCGGNEGNPGDIGADYLLSLGETQLDLLVLTHFDDDHVGGVPELLRRTRVHALAIPDVASSARNEIVTQALELGTEIYIIRQDTTVSFGDGVVTLFSPLGKSSDNEAGLSVLADIGDFEVLLTGDMSEETEEILLEQQDIPRVDVLLAGHHGSKHSTSEQLLTETAPEYVIISVGDNRYGHPTEEVLQRIEKQGAILYRTDQDGNVTIRGT